LKYRIGDDELLRVQQVYCSTPLHFYDPHNFEDASASEYGGYTIAEFTG